MFNVKILSFTLSQVQNINNFGIELYNVRSIEFFKKNGIKVLKKLSGYQVFLHG